MKLKNSELGKIQSPKRKHLLAMPRTMLSDEHWSKLKPILLDLNIYNKPNLRNIFEGILFCMRVGCPWRDIPEAFGSSNTIFKAFRRWSKKQ